MRLLDPLENDGDTTKKLTLPTGKGFIASVEGTFGGASVVIEFLADNGSGDVWVPFSNAQALIEPFQYKVEAHAPISVRARVVGSPTAPLILNGGAEYDNRNSQ